MNVRFRPPAGPLALLFSFLCLSPTSPVVAADDERVVIVIFGGFGTTAGARLWGRVLADKGFDQPQADESLHQRLLMKLGCGQREPDGHLLAGTGFGRVPAG